MTETYLVIGATGAQGGAVAKRLERDGNAVRGFSRKRGDLADAAAVGDAFGGVSRASVTLPMVFDAGGVLPYPLPPGHRVAWLAHDDLGALTAAALTPIRTWAAR